MILRSLLIVATPYEWITFRCVTAHTYRSCMIPWAQPEHVVGSLMHGSWRIWIGHAWMSHGTHDVMSSATTHFSSLFERAMYECVMTHTNQSHMMWWAHVAVSLMYESWHIWIGHVWMSHVTYDVMSSATTRRTSSYEKSHVWMHYGTLKSVTHVTMSSARTRRRSNSVADNPESRCGRWNSSRACARDSRPMKTLLSPLSLEVLLVVAGSTAFSIATETD